MPTRCVVSGCSNTPDASKGIFLHKIPFYGDDRPEAKLRRKQWIDFVKRKRANFTASATSVVCSAHFRPDDYFRRFSYVPNGRPQLLKDDIGCVAIPKIHSNSIDGNDQMSSRERRKILRDVKTSFTYLKQEEEVNNVRKEEVELTFKQSDDPETAALLSASAVGDDTNTVTENNNESSDCSDHMQLEKTVDRSCQTKDCVGCAHLQNSNRLLRNKIIDYQDKIESLKTKQEKKTASIGVQCAMAYDGLGEMLEEMVSDVSDNEDDDVVEAEQEVENEEDEECVSDGEVSEDDYQSDSDPETASDESSFQQKEGLTNLRKERKYIVFLSKLALLFQFCHSCKSDAPVLTEYKESGTMVTFKTVCQNPKCPKREFKWSSQPLMPNSRIPAGNFLLAFAILLSGGCASKVIQMFSHMGLACISLKSYFKHQKERLFPAIYLHWKKYLTQIMDKLKGTEDPLVVSGDGRFDSMGHSAKYGTYTIFCCTVPMIIYFSLVQRNEAGSSNALEMVGFTRCMTFLLGSGLAIKTFISDRHTSISKYMREKLSHITHYFDLWHLKKSVKKRILKIAKLDGCEELKDWIQPCLNHLHWSAASTISGHGRIIWAKFKSFLGHIVNKHDNLDDSLFHKCAHGPDIKQRKWLHTDSEAHEKLKAALTKQSIVQAIQKASPTDQTSCLEGFHSLLNHFSPKMLAYSHSGMFCRHVLAVLHFNSNLTRDPKTKAGIKQVKITYPKFKNGEATIKDVRVKPKFGYVEDIYNTYLEAVGRLGSLVQARKDLKEMTPAPMHTMLNKQPREKAMEKKRKRDSMVVIDVPPTTPLTDVLAQEEARRKRKKRSQPCCRVCKNLMRGHNLVLDCPVNLAKLRSD